MGLIKEQSIKGTLYSYLGIVIGFFTVAILIPNILSAQEYGVLKLLISFSILLSRFANLGINSVTSRMFSYFRDKNNKHNGYIFLVTIVISVGFILSILIFFAIKPIIIKHSIEKSSLFIQYVFYIIPLIFATLIFDTLDNYTKVLYNATIGTLLKDFILRILILVLVIIYMCNIIDYNLFIFFYVIANCTPTIIILFYLIFKKDINLKPKLEFLSKDLVKQIISVSFFGILGGFSGIVIQNIDFIMINSFVGLKFTGIYGITFYFATLIMIPSRSILKISTPVIADALKEKNLSLIDSVYKKTCITQTTLGLLIFIGIWANIHNIFKILPSEYELGKYVIFFICLANLFDIASGANGLIIGLSRFYKFQTYFIFILSILVVITNYIFIPKFGIVGAAFASFLAKLIFNFLKFLFVYRKFNMQPYNYKYLILILISIVCYFSSTFISEIDLYYSNKFEIINMLPDIIIRSSFITILFLFLIIKFKVSEDINSFFYNFFRLFKTK